MKILALDAALGFFSAALDFDGIITCERSGRNDALESGLERLARLLATAGLELHALDRIAVGIGPGSFTGIRIALSFAKALAFGAGVPLVGVSSYDILTPPDAVLPCLTVVSGRPGVVCARLLESARSRTACGPVADVMSRLLANTTAGTDLTIFANTEDVVPPIGEAALTVHRTFSPAARNPAAVIAELARRRQPVPSSHALAPDYGELPAVTVPKAGTVSLAVGE